MESDIRIPILACFAEVFLRSSHQVGNLYGRTSESNLFQLTRRTLAEDAEDTLVIIYQFGNSCHGLFFFLCRQLSGAEFTYQLLDFAGVINCFVLDGRKTIVQHHILYMQHTVFPRGTPRFVLCQFDVPVFYSQFHNSIENDDGYVAGYELQQQTVGTLFATFAPLNAQGTNTTVAPSSLDGQGENLDAGLRLVAFLFVTATHQSGSALLGRHHGVFVLTFGCICHIHIARTGDILQLM